MEQHFMTRKADVLVYTYSNAIHCIPVVMTALFEISSQYLLCSCTLLGNIPHMPPHTVESTVTTSFASNCLRNICHTTSLGSDHLSGKTTRLPHYIP